MKTPNQILLAVLMLLAISCTKENNSIQSSVITDESPSQAVSTDVNEPATYTSVKLGSQLVMKKNLNVNRYRNGDLIPQVKNSAKWAALTTGAWCWYNNDSATGAVYGKLYNWYAVNDPRGLAPEGWHIPSDAECTTLINSIGGDAAAGGKMKATGTLEDGTGLWYAPNTGATNSSGFTGLPGGYRSYAGPFYDINGYGYWWSSTEGGTTYAWGRGLYYLNSSIVGRYGQYDKTHGFSVRCVKD